MTLWTGSATMADHHERPEIRVEAPVGGWPHPWRNAAEIADVLSPVHWTLVGGLMTRLHSVHRGLGVVRPTNDVDIVLHIETARGVPTKAATALESLGYRLQEKVDPRDNTAHRWMREAQVIDVTGSQVDDEDDQQDHDDQQEQRRRRRLDAHHVDVLTADHPAPIVIERMRGRDMVPIEGPASACCARDRAVPRP
jgi:hypothetical protein